MNAFEAMRAARTMDAGPSCRLVFVMLVGRIGAHERAWPSMSTLCADTGLGETAVRAALCKLVAAGHLEVAPRHGQSSLWTLGERHTPSECEGVTPSECEGDPLGIHQSPPRNVRTEVDKKRDKKYAATDSSARRPVAAENGNGAGPAPGESWGEYRERGGR